jgi:hypothetical protein
MRATRSKFPTGATHLVLMLVLLLAAFSPAAAVDDADTLTIAKIRYRLHGVDAPGGSGAIIHGFVTAARTIAVANILLKGDTGADAARDRASQDLFDGTLRRIEEHDRLLGPVRPRAATILDIVGSELGVLPHPLKETIEGVLDFKGGPK